MAFPLSMIYGKNQKLGLWSIIALVLMLMVGLCLINFQHHVLSDGDMCPNPCSVDASLLLVTLFIVLLVVNLLGHERVESLYLVPLRPLEIPPEIPALT